MSTIIFSEKFLIIGVNPYVRPPDDILLTIFKQAGRETSPIPIQGKINGAEFQQSLVRYQGDWRLYVNTIMAKAAKIPFSKSIQEIVGQSVTFEIEYNPKPHVHKMIPLLQNALDANETAKANWEKLTPSRQKEILRYFSGLRSDDAKERNLRKVIAVLTGKEGRFMARNWKDGR